MIPLKKLGRCSVLGSAWLLASAAALANDGAFSVSDYLMDEDREIALARSAAPAKVSGDATVLVLTLSGYRRVTEGTNGYVCLVLRSWGNPTHDPAWLYAPKIIVPECLDPWAVETILPMQLFRAELGVAGTPASEIQAQVETRFHDGSLKRTETVSFSYMLSAAMTLADGSPLTPHVMVYLPDGYTNEMLGGLGYGDAVALVEGGPHEPFTAANIFRPDGGIEPEIASDARIFEPGLVSTGDAENYSASFSPHGEVMYFTRGRDILWIARQGDGWSEPRRANFSTGEWAQKYMTPGEDIEYFNWDGVFSPDGEQMVIMSHGLIDGRITAGEDGDIGLWIVEREGAGYDGDSWGEPRYLGPGVNRPDSNEGAASMAADGTIFYFASGRPDGFGRGDIYFSKPENGEYRTAVHLGSVINTPGWEGHSYIAADGEFLLFLSYVDGGYGSCDLYASRRTADGWSAPVNLGPKVNTDACELVPSLTPDGRTLFFARQVEKGVRNIYSIPLAETDFPMR